MRLRGIRRVPVVSEGGALVGIVSADDLLGFLAEEMEELSRISPHQQQHESGPGRAPSACSATVGKPS
jgi:predicted transcriptional regulator